MNKQVACVIYAGNGEDGVGKALFGHVHRDSEMIRRFDPEHLGSVDQRTGSRAHVDGCDSLHRFRACIEYSPRTNDRRTGVRNAQSRRTTAWYSSRYASEELSYLVVNLKGRRNIRNPSVHEDDGSR